MIRNNPNIRKFNKVFVPTRAKHISDITGSLSGLSAPSTKKNLSGVRNYTGGNKVVKEEKQISTGSLQNLEAPSTKKNLTGIKESSTPIKYIPNINKLNDFDKEIFEYSARYVKRHIDRWNEYENTITILNVLLDYGTEGPGPENFEVIVNGIHSPGIYTIKQVGNDVVVTFTERLFTYDGLQKENVIVIGKLLDIALLTERLTENSIVITSENDEPLIL